MSQYFTESILVFDEKKLQQEILMWGFCLFNLRVFVTDFV